MPRKLTLAFVLLIFGNILKHEREIYSWGGLCFKEELVNSPLTFQATWMEISYDGVIFHTRTSAGQNVSMSLWSIPTASKPKGKQRVLPEQMIKSHSSFQSLHWESRFGTKLKLGKWCHYLGGSTPPVGCWGPRSPAEGAIFSQICICKE